MIFPSWFRWLVFRIVLDGFWRQYITTFWYHRERIHLHRSSWGLDVALMSVRRCLIFVLCRLHRSIITARQQQLRSNSLGTRSRLCFPLPACRSCFGLSPALRCCLPYGLYYHRWSCQCKKFLFARVTYLVKLLDAIFVCFRRAIFFLPWTSFGVLCGKARHAYLCDCCLSRHLFARIYSGVGFFTASVVVFNTNRRNLCDGCNDEFSNLDFARFCYVLSDCSDGCVVDCSCIVCIHQAGSTGQRFVTCGLAGQLLCGLHSIAFSFAFHSHSSLPVRCYRRMFGLLSLTASAC